MDSGRVLALRLKLAAEYFVTVLAISLVQRLPECKS
jgi:hypothetical protein